MFDSIEAAINSLNDTGLSELEREKAIVFLEENRSPEAVDALIAMLEDDDTGVRWKAASALAVYGESAIHALLLALAQPDSDERIREGARHILHQNSSMEIREETRDLQKALHGSGSNIATLEEANKLLIKYR